MVRTFFGSRHIRVASFLVLTLFLLGISPILTYAQAGSPAGSDAPQTSSIIQDVTASDLAPTYAGCGDVRVGPIELAFEQRVVELTNQERAANGLPPFAYNEDLTYAARYHAVDMSQDNYFDHNSLDRNGDLLHLACQWYERLRDYYPAGAQMGENIAWNYRSPEAVVEGWMNSEGHRANILGSYREIGVGFHDWYWVQDFGTRPNVFPVVINGEAAAVASPEVSLYVYGDWDDVRLRNDGENWSPWQPFSNELAWIIPTVPGLHTVDLELRAGEITLVSTDSIEYIGPANDPGPIESTPAPTSTTAPPASVPTATPTPSPTLSPTAVAPKEATATETATETATSAPVETAPEETASATPTPSPTLEETPPKATTAPPSPTAYPGSPQGPDLFAASYIGGDGADTVAAIDIAPDGSILLAGTFSGLDTVTAAGHVIDYVPTAAGSDTRGAVVRLSENGTTLSLITVIGTEVADMEIADDGRVVVCGDFGLALLADTAETLQWFANPGPIRRCAISGNGLVAVLQENTIHTYDQDGTDLGAWALEGVVVEDIAVVEPGEDAEEIVAATGYRQLRQNLQVAFLHGWTLAGESAWQSYDHANFQGFNAKTRGRRVVRGRDGLLYFAATIQGGTSASIFARDPHAIETAADERIVRYDEFNTATNAGRATITWYGRYAPESGDLLLGQSLLTRRRNGNGNSIIPYGLAADRDGRLYVSGSAWASIADRDTQSLTGEPVGDYEDAEPFVLAVSPDFEQRVLWSTFAQENHSAGESPAVGVAVRNGVAAVGISAVTQQDRLLQTAPSAIQAAPSGSSDGYIAAWAQIALPEPPETAGQSQSGHRVYLPMVLNR